MYVLPGDTSQPDVGVVLPPRTGTRSVVEAIEPLGAYKVGSKHRIPQEMPDVDIVVSTIRNPYDVLVSWYHFPDKEWGQHRKYNIGGGGRSWPEFLDYVFSGEHRWLEKSTLPGADNASDFIRYELGVGVELNRILRLAGRPPVDVPHVGRTVRPRYQAWYTLQQRQKVRERFADDFETFNYEF